MREREGEKERGRERGRERERERERERPVSFEFVHRIRRHDEKGDLSENCTVELRAEAGHLIYYHGLVLV